MITVDILETNNTPRSSISWCLSRSLLIPTISRPWFHSQLIRLQICYVQIELQQSEHFHHQPKSISPPPPSPNLINPTVLQPNTSIWYSSRGTSSKCWTPPVFQTCSVDKRLRTTLTKEQKQNIPQHRYTDRSKRRNNLMKAWDVTGMIRYSELVKSVQTFRLTDAYVHFSKHAVNLLQNRKLQWSLKRSHKIFVQKWRQKMLGNYVHCFLMIVWK